MLRTFPAKVQVFFQVGLKNFSSVSEDDFEIYVNYEDVLKNESDQIPLKLRNSPDHVGHVRIVPSSVDFLIEERYTKLESDKK